MSSIPVLATPFLAQGEGPSADAPPASPETGQEGSSTPRGKPNGLDRESFISDTEADGSEVEHPSGWWSSRSRGRDEESRKLFSLPLTEHLMDDYMCALQRRMLHQGRLYIFEHYVCFNSSIFGYEKNRVIPLKDVTAIKKKKNCGFPNSIEISYSGKKDFFTSFLFREDAFRLLSYAWNRSNSGYVKLFGGPDTEKALKAVMTKVSKTSSAAGSSPRHASGELPSDAGSKGGASYRKGKVYGSSKLAKILHRRKTSDGGSNEPATQSSLESSNDSQVFGTRNKESPELLETFETRTEEGSESGDDDAGSGTGDAEKWQPQPMAAPPVDPAMKPVLQEKFGMPVKELYHQFFSDESQFVTTWHEARGDTKVQKTAWQSHSSMGHVRQIKFVTPLKQVIGPSKCLCEQTQRMRLFQGEHLVLETSQIMSEIPYGDHFKVEARWDITPDQGGRACKLDTHLAIPFSKKTIWKSTIEKSTQDSIKAAMEDWVRTAKRWMEPPLPLPPGSAFSGGKPIEGNIGAGSTEQTHMSRAQSLAIRLSSDRSPDMDGLLDRVPSEYRNDVARVLKLRRLETEQQMAKKMSRAMSHKVSYAQLPDEVESLPSIKRLITWPRILVAIVAFALLALQVLILLRASGIQSALPSGLRSGQDSLGSALVCPAPGNLEQQAGLDGGQSPAERPGVEDLAAMQGQLLELRRHFEALQSRLDHYTKMAEAQGA